MQLQVSVSREAPYDGGRSGPSFASEGVCLLVAVCGQLCYAWIEQLASFIDGLLLSPWEAGVERTRVAAGKMAQDPRQTRRDGCRK